MRCEFPMLALTSPFHAARQDFERRLPRARGEMQGVRVVENDSAVVISIDVPGVAEDDLTVDFHEGLLTVTGSRETELEEGTTEVFSDRWSGEFQRTLRVDESLDPDSIDAVLDRGVLTITMQRRPELKPRSITIRSAN